MKAHLPVLLVCAFAMLAGAANASAAGRIAYVTDYDSEVIRHLHTGTDAFLTSSFTGGLNEMSRGQMTPDGKQLWVPLYTPGKVAVFDLVTGQARPTLDVGGNPVAVTFSPDGRRGYVLDEVGDEVEVYDTATLQKVGPPWQTGDAPDHLAASPDGKSLYVANLAARTISVLDTATGQDRMAPVPVCDGHGRLDSMALSPDGTTLYTGCRSPHAVEAIDTGTMTATPLSVPMPEAPEYLTVSPDGDTVWAVLFKAGEVTAIDGAGGTIEGESIEVGAEPYQVAITPDGTKAYVPNSKGGGISVIDTASLRAGAPIPDDDGPRQVAITPNQGPVATFTAPDRVIAGKAFFLDASASKDADGSVARYAWNFGDGTSGTEGDPDRRHSFSKPGTYRVTLTVTDEEGCSDRFVSTGSTVYCNGSKVATHTKTIVATLPDNGFTFGRVTLNRRKGTARLRVKLPGPGLLRLGGRNVGPDRFAGGPGRAVLTVRATGRAERILKRRGRVTLKARVTFTPRFGKAETKTKTVRLVRRR